MTNKDLLRIAMEQSAIDSGCQPEDFMAKENKVVISTRHPAARGYLELPFICDLTSYGGNIVASVQADMAGLVQAYIQKYPAVHCFETPNLHVLNDALQQRGYRICFMAEYFLPDLERLRPLPCGYETRLLYPADFASLYKPEWGNALCEKRKEADCLGVGAFDRDKLVGLAACSADCETMRQIGIDVLPEYRRQGIAAALTSRLAVEIVKRDKVPFYCAAWSNIGSVRCAVKSGFRPAWVQVTAKSEETVAKMNR